MVGTGQGKEEMAPLQSAQVTDIVFLNCKLNWPGYIIPIFVMRSHFLQIMFCERCVYVFVIVYLKYLLCLKNQ